MNEIEVETFYENGVLMVRYPDGSVARLADVYRQAFPGREFDDLTGLEMAAPPPAADASSAQPASPAYQFGDVGSRMGNKTLAAAADTFANAGNVTRSMLPESLQAYVPPSVSYLPDMALGGLLGALGGGEKAIGYGAELGDMAARSVIEGLGFNYPFAPGTGARKLAGDLIGGLDAAGAAPEGRMVGAILDAAGPVIRRGVMDAASDFGTDEFGGVGFRAYHGSPHDFDKFDLSKIGTGEGAQAYGHGLYFAENEGIARFYRDALASRGATFRNEPIDYPTGNSPFEKAVSSVLSRINLGDTPDEALQFLLDRYARGLPFDQSGNGAAVLDALRSLSPSDFNINPGRMYEVRINADPNDFLDWSKPLALQDAKPKAALDEFFDWYMGPQARDEMYAAGITPRDVQEHFDDLSPKQFSFAMRSRGVPGSKYPDAGSRGMPGALGSDPSRNYVVFDDSMIEILRKYGLLAPTAGLGAYALGKPTEAQAAAGGLLEDRR